MLHAIVMATTWTDANIFFLSNISLQPLPIKISDGNASKRKRQTNHPDCSRNSHHHHLHHHHLFGVTLVLSVSNIRQAQREQKRFLNEDRLSFVRQSRITTFSSFHCSSLRQWSQRQFVQTRSITNHLEKFLQSIWKSNAASGKGSHSILLAEDWQFESVAHLSQSRLQYRVQCGEWDFNSTSHFHPTSGGSQTAWLLCGEISLRGSQLDWLQDSTQKHNQQRYVVEKKVSLEYFSHSNLFLFEAIFLRWRTHSLYTPCFGATYPYRVCVRRCRLSHTATLTLGICVTGYNMVGNIVSKLSLYSRQAWPD